MSRRSLRARYLVLHALRWLPVGLLAPILTLLPLERGLSLGQVGLLFAVYGATTAVLEVPTGGLADVRGRRPVLIGSSLLHLGFFLLLIGARTPTAWMLAFLAGAVARSLDSGPLEAWFVEESRATGDESDLRTGLSAAGVIEGVAMGMAAIAGGLLPVILARGLEVVVWVAAAAQVVHLAAVPLLMREPDRPRAGPNSHLGLGTVLREGKGLVQRGRSVWRLLAVKASIGLALLSLEVLWQPRFTDLLGDRSATGPLGFILAGAFMLGAVGSSLGPWLVRRFRGRVGRAASAAGGAQALVFAWLALSGAVVPAVAAFLGWYLVAGARFPLHSELLHLHVPDRLRTTMISLDSLVLQGGGLVGSLTVPVLAETVGIPAAWLAAAAVLGAAALLYRGVDDASSTGEAPPAEAEMVSP